MVSARLKILTLKVIIIVFVMAMALTQMKHECMGFGFIPWIMIFFVMKQRPQKRPHQKVLRDG